MNVKSLEVLERAARQADIRLDDTDRIILQYLVNHKSATVTEIENAIDSVSRTVVFYRLLTFKGAGLVTSSRKSRNVVQYSLSSQARAILSSRPSFGLENSKNDRN
jgi:DNA-binding transcriptional ArsR family regulator